MNMNEAVKASSSISTTLSSSELEACRKAFAAYDKDGTCPCVEAAPRCTAELTGRRCAADSGTIDTQELRAVMQTLGHSPTDEELYILISQARLSLLLLLSSWEQAELSWRAQVDEDRSGAIDFREFVLIFEKQRASGVSDADESMTVEAFVAMGGQACSPRLPLLMLAAEPTTTVTANVCVQHT